MMLRAAVLLAVFSPPMLRADEPPKSGTILVYEVDKGKKSDPKPDFAALAEILKKRIDPGDTLKVVVRPADKGRVEIILPALKKDDLLRIKQLIARVGSLEFRVLANEHDDAEAIKAAKAYFKNESNKAALKAAQERGEPPPGPRDPKTGKPRVFTIKLAGGETSKVSYGWVELGPAERQSLQLDNAMEKEKDPIKKWFWLQAELARKDGAAVFLTFQNQVGHYLLHGALFYSRVCKDRNLPEDERKSKAYEYFVLVRDPEIDPKDQSGTRRTPNVDGSYLTQALADVAGDARTPAVFFGLNARGAELFGNLTRKNVSEKDVKRHLAIILDGLVQSAPTINSEIRDRGQITGNFTKQEVDNLVNILRAGALPVPLNPKPVSETTIDKGKPKKVEELRKLIEESRARPPLVDATDTEGSRYTIEYGEKQTVFSKDSEPRKMLYRFHLAEAQKHFDARRAEIAKLMTPDDVAKRQAYLKAKFIEALGDFPEKTPLNEKVAGEVKGDGFRVLKVIFESRPHHHVTGNLYIPDNLKPGEKAPGVLVPCGHSANGKAADTYQRACILMARNGMVVFCYDPIGQGERIQLLDKTGKPAIKGSTSEHTMVGVGALLVGRSTATYRIWDGIRAMDFLAGRPEVDASRLGCTGNSGGGTLTAYLMALDDRIQCAAPSCYITTLEKLFATLGPQDAEQNITGQVAFGMEHADYITMRAPRPTLICTGTYDYFDIHGAWTSVREASRVYSKLGFGERVAMFEYEDKHGFWQPRREAAARWMSRWLLGKDVPIKEGKWPAFTDADLQCTRSGQVLEDFKGKSVFTFNREDAAALAPERAKFLTLGAEERTATIRRVLGLSANIPAAKIVHKGSSAVGRDRNIYKVVFATEPGIQVPGLWISGGAKAAQQPFTICLHEHGLDAAISLSKGANLLALDLRGLGETAPGVFKLDKSGHFGVDSKDAFMGIHLNRPLMGQRVYDLLSVIAKVSEGASEFRLIAVGPTLGPIALHAAALDPRIRSVEIHRGLLSWNDVVQTPLSVNQLTNVVPGVLKFYDLPELAATLAPRPLRLDAVNARYQTVPADEARRAYEVCRDAYRDRKAEENLKIGSDAK